MSNIGTVSELFEKAIALEQGSVDFYRHLAGMFSDHPDVVKFWLLMAEEERGHGAYLERLHGRISAADLDKPGDSQLLESARKLAAVSTNELLRRVYTLDDAYNLAIEVENSETNAIFEFMLLNFSGDDLNKSQAFLRVQLHRHLTAFERDFPSKYKGHLSRQNVKAIPPSSV